MAKRLKQDLICQETTQGDTLDDKGEKLDSIIESEVIKMKEDSDENNVNTSNKVLKMDTDTDKDKENENEMANVEPALPSILNQEEEEEETSFKVIYNKNRYDISFPLSGTVMQLKTHLQNIIGVPQAMQKVMIKGLAKDERTLKDLGVTKGAKIMVVGSKLDDVLAVSTPSQLDVTEDKPVGVSKEPFCKQKMHRKVLDKGIPDDVMPGIKNLKEALPQFPISGMLNKHGGKVRLTFKLELDQLWIGTKERTDKIPMNSIKNVVSEAIEEHEEYHIMALQLGPTEASRYWVYWVPAQYVDAIKDAILGTWPL